MKPTIYTNEELDQCVQSLRNDGMGRGQIARTLRVRYPRVVASMIRLTGMPVQHGNRSFTDSQEETIAGRYASGESSRALAAEYRCHPFTVRTIGKRYGYVRGRNVLRRTLSSEDEAEIARSHLSGHTRKVIATTLRIPLSLVSETIERTDLARANPRVGPKSPNWRGGRTHRAGYIFVHIPRDHPFAAMRSVHGYVPEHRLKVATFLGRALEDGEVVHHINGDSEDNRLDNLQLRRQDHGRGQCFRCLDCGSSNIGAVPLPPG
jgi:hypothetical protein